jgi:hypothetical protein
MECKYWLDREHFEAAEAFSYNMGPPDRREVKRLIFKYFEDFEKAWDKFQEQKR